MTDIDGRAILDQGPFNNVDRALNAGAKAPWLSEDDLNFWAILRCHNSSSPHGPAGKAGLHDKQGEFNKIRAKGPRSKSGPRAVCRALVFQTVSYFQRLITYVTTPRLGLYQYVSLRARCKPCSSDQTSPFHHTYESISGEYSAQQNDRATFASLPSCVCDVALVSWCWVGECAGELFFVMAVEWSNLWVFFSSVKKKR